MNKPKQKIDELKKSECRSSRWRQYHMVNEVQTVCDGKDAWRSFEPEVGLKWDSKAMNGKNLFIYYIIVHMVMMKMIRMNMWNEINVNKNWLAVLTRLTKWIRQSIPGRTAGKYPSKQLLALNRKNVVTGPVSTQCMHVFQLHRRRRATICTYCTHHCHLNRFGHVPAAGKYNSIQVEMCGRCSSIPRTRALAHQ